MKSSTIAIKQADGTFYPVIEDGKPGKKDIVLTPAMDAQETTKIELFRGQGNDMDDPQPFGVLNLKREGAVTGEINLTLDLEADGNFSAIAGFKGSSEKHEFYANINNEAEFPHFEAQDMEDSSMDLGDMDDLDGMEATEEESFDFDMEDENPPKTDQEILDDDSLAEEGLDDFTFDDDGTAGEAELPEEVEGAVSEDDLGDLSSFDSFSELDTELPEDSLPSMNLEDPGDLTFETPDLDLNLNEDTPTEDSAELSEFSLDDDFSLDLEPQDLQGPEVSVESLDSMDPFSMDDLEELGGDAEATPKKEPAPAFVVGPKDFALSLGSEDEDLPPPAVETPAVEDDFSLGDMDFGNLEGEINLDSSLGDFNNEDFSLEDQPRPETNSDNDSVQDEPLVVERKKPEPKKTKPNTPSKKASKEQVSGSERVHLVLFLGLMVVLLGMFLGLLFIHMTRLTLIPPVQAYNLNQVKAVEPVELVLDVPVFLSPLATQETQQRIISQDIYGIPFFYQQIPLAN